VAWLSARAAVNGRNVQATEAIVQDCGYGFWFAEPFPDEDVDDAAAYLTEKGLAEGPTVDQLRGPAQIWLTDDGVECADQLDFSVTDYLRSKGSGMSGGISFTGSNYGQVASGQNFSQTQTVNNAPSAEQVRKLIVSLAQMVALALPDQAEEATRQQSEALDAARDGAVDRPRLIAFRAWALGIVGRGASQALVPLVQSGTTDMMHEIGKLTGIS
jgi:hypothetical protein